MLAIYHNSPHMPRTPPRHTPDDLDWWERTLDKPGLERRIPRPQTFVDVRAFSDASSEVGIGVIIGERWRAWVLCPGWKSDTRDIGWAEAVGFEFLLRILLRDDPGSVCIKVFGDNKGVIDGWRNGRSHNWEVNLVFRRIHRVLASTASSVHAEYVASTDNPADKPSRGIYPPSHLLLPPIEIPPPLQHVVDHDSPTAQAILARVRPRRSQRPHLPASDATPASHDIPYKLLTDPRFWGKETF